MLRFCLRNLARPSPITSLHSLHSLSPLVSAARTGTMGSVGTVGTARTARAGIVGKGTRGRWCQPCRHSSTGQKITQSGSSGRSGSRSSGGGSGGNGGGGGRGKAERDDEGMLLASTDPIGIISSRFNPYVIRHFKEFRDAVGGPGAGIGGIGGIGGGTGVGGMGGKGGGQGQELGEGVEGVEGVEGNQGTRSKSLRIAFRKTEDTLLSLNHSIKRVPNRSVYRNHLSFKHEAKRSSLGENCSRMLRECRSDREYAALAAFMTIMVPKSEQVWLDYDRYILNMLQRGRCSGEVGLLSVNAVLTAQEEHTFQGSRFKSPKAYVEHLLAGRKALGAGEWGVGGGCVGGAGVEGGVGTGVGAGADVNIFDAESFARAWQVQAPKAGGAGAGAGAGGAGKGARNSTSTPTTPTPVTPPQAEMFASIGVKAQVRDSPDAERLGLQLRLLALVMPWRAGMASQKEHKTLLQDMTSQGIKVLSGLHNPVKLNTLRVIWEHAPHVHLPNSYFFYKLLYEQVLYSLTAEPLQLVGQERAVAKLLESMVLSKFKSSQLLACLQEVTGRQGMEAHCYGMDMFGSLVELDAIPFAVTVLEAYLNSVRVELIYSQGVKGQSLHFSERARAHLYSTLNAVPSSQYRHCHLVVMLFCFNRAERHSPHYRLLERIEGALLGGAGGVGGGGVISGGGGVGKGLDWGSVGEDRDGDSIGDSSIGSDSISGGGGGGGGGGLSSLSAHNAIGLLYSYAMSGRRHPAVCSVLENIIHKQVHMLPLPQLSACIWACARLDLRGASFLPLAASRYLQVVTKRPSGLSQGDAMALSRVLWSLAALQLLSKEVFEEVKVLLERFVERGDGSEMHSWMYNQLNQVHMEMSLEGREQMGEQMGKEEGEEGEEGEGGDSGDSAPFSGGSVRETEESDSRHNHHNNSNNNTTISSSATSSSSSFRGPRSLPWQQPPGSPIRIHADLGSSVTHLDASRLLSRIGVRHSNEALLDNGYAVDIFLPPVGGGDVGGGGDGASDGQGTGAGARRHKGIAVEFDGPSHFESYLQQPLGPTAMKRRHILGSGYLLAAIPYWKYRIDMPEEMRVRILQRYIAEAEGEGER